MEDHIKSIITFFFLFCIVSLYAQQPERIMSLNELFSLADTQSKTIKIMNVRKLPIKKFDV